MAQRVIRTRNGGTWTEAEYFGRIRGALRKTFSYWKPMQKALQEARRPNQSPNKRMKWEYRCAHCNRWCKRDEVEIDHIIPCGSLKKLEDIPSFIERLTAERSEDYQILCTSCHRIKTNLK